MKMKLIWHLYENKFFWCDTEPNQLKLRGISIYGLFSSMYSPVESEQGFNFKPELPTSSAYYRLLKKLRRQVGHAIRDFKMIEDGDKVMVCISGGKDSYTLLDILLQFKRIAPINFDVVAVNLTRNSPVSRKMYYRVI